MNYAAVLNDLTENTIFLQRFAVLLLVALAAVASGQHLDLNKVKRMSMTSMVHHCRIAAGY